MTADRVALDDSQTVAWLFEEVHKTNDISKHDLVALLKLIDAPANLSGLFLVLNNLTQVLGKAESIQELDSDRFPKFDIERALETCKTLIMQEMLLQECPVLSRLFPDSSRSVWEQLCGSIENYPLFSSLCFAPRDLDSRNIYSQLQAQVLLASQIIIEAEQDLSDLKDSFLSVRKLSELPFEQELLALPAQIISGEEYLAMIRRARPDSQTYKVGKILQCAFHGKRRKTVRTRGGREGKALQGISLIEGLEDDENPAAIWTGENFAPKGVLSEEESQDYCMFGGSASEFSGGQDDVPIPVADERTISRATLAELAFQAKHRSNQEALKNQLNPLGWNELNQYDLHVLLTFLSEEGGAGTKDPQNLFLRDSLSLMFWLSAPLERILRLRKINGASNTASPEGLYLKDDRILIARLHSPGPQLESQSINKTSKLAYEVEYHCDIPLPILAHTDRLLNSCRISTQSSSQSLEATEIDDGYVDSMTRQIRAELGNLNRMHGTRLSIGRICHYWLHALGRQPGEDPPSAMLFFGHRERFSVARLHYTCAPAQRMELAYRKICSDLLKELGYTAGFPGEDVVNEPIYLGTPFCPRPESVRSLVKSLRQAVEQSRPVSKHFGTVKNFHNHFALYTACLIAFSTTYRAVRDPSLYEKDIHFASGLGVISDKDDDTFYHSRFVWISDICRQQIINYRRHLQRLYELFAVQSPALFRLFGELDQQGRPLQLFYIPHANDSLLELRPSLIEEILQGLHTYDLAANTHRHYLKSELLRSGCPLEVIEAQLGHWEQGQEPWCRFSNIHPREFCRQLDLHLTPILKRDKWVALKGYDL